MKGRCVLKNLMTGIVCGAIIGGIVGTVASDEIYDMKNMVMKKSKKFAKKMRVDVVIFIIIYGNGAELLKKSIYE